MKHGLAAEVVRTPEEERAVVEAALAAKSSGSEAGSQEAWIAGEITVLTMRINRAHQAEDRERERASMRSKSLWHEDRAREADRIGRGLARRPERVVLRLRATVQGCAWLIARWNWLRTAADQPGGWTADQCSLAFDLQGIPVGYREPTPANGGQKSLADSQIQALETLRQASVPVDVFEQETTRLQLDNGATPELRQVIRYEAALHRRLRWCFDQKGPKQAIIPAPTSTPAPAPAPTPTPMSPPITVPIPQPSVSVGVRIPEWIAHRDADLNALIHMERVLNTRMTDVALPASSRRRSLKAAQASRSRR